ncbi:MAG: hypothetical protein M1820_003377 [Bogoriella megaspora]|nr:MAG: hypothetical protein M1820_003377 [Bogoriella megaspora]
MAAAPPSEPGLPRRIPKLTYRNRFADGSQGITSPVTAISFGNTVNIVDEKVKPGMEDHFAGSSLGDSPLQSSRPSSDRDSLAITPIKDSISIGQTSSLPGSNSRPSTARSYSSTSSGRTHTSASKHAAKPGKKKSGMMNFLSLKEPSTLALEEFAEQQRKANIAKGNKSMTTLPGVSSQKLPPSVPKVNSKWDGMPETSRSKDDSRSLSSRRESVNTLGRSLMSQTQTSLSRSLAATTVSEMTRAPPNSLASLSAYDDRASTPSTIQTESNSSVMTISPALQFPDLIKPTPGALSVHTLSTLKTPSMPSLTGPSNYVPPAMLKFMETPDLFGSLTSDSSSEEAPRQQEPSKPKNDDDSFDRKSEPDSASSPSWPSKPLHSPHGSTDSHIHPALRESGKIYESDSSNSSREGLHQQISGASTPRDESPLTPTDSTSFHPELSDTDTLPRSRDTNETSFTGNWPLPSGGSETVPAHQEISTPALSPLDTSLSALKYVQIDGQVAMDDEADQKTPTNEKILAPTPTFNFSRRGNFQRTKAVSHKTPDSSTREIVPETTSKSFAATALITESEGKSEFTVIETMKPGDHQVSIHLGVGFDESDLASIAESQAPSELSERWFKPTKERLGLGTKMLKKDSPVWDGEEEHWDRKKRFSMPRFNRG